MSRTGRLLPPLVLLVLFSGAVPAAGSDLEEDLSDVTTRIDDLSSQISSAAASRSSLARDLRQTKVLLDDALSALAQVRGNLVLLEAEIVGKRRALAVAEQDLQAQQFKLVATRAELDRARLETHQWARETYMTAGLGSSQVIFSATAVSDLALGVEYLGLLTEQSNAAVLRFEALTRREAEIQADIEMRQAELEAELATLSKDEGQLSGLREVLQRRGADLEDELTAQRALLADIDDEIAHWEGELGGLETQQAAIEQLIAERASTAGSAPGILAKPVSGPIVSSFGPRVHPIHGGVRMHHGVDIDAPQGHPIVAGDDGRVILAGAKGGYGLTVMIDHGGGMVTLYAHQSSLAVGEGARVSAGQRIGSVGSTGVSTGPHLHFEVRISGSPVNPVPYF